MMLSCLVCLVRKLAEHEASSLAEKREEGSNDAFLLGNTLGKEDKGVLGSNDISSLGREDGSGDEELYLAACSSEKGMKKSSVC